MHKVEIKIGKKVRKYRAPESWGELSPKQYRKLAPFLLANEIYRPAVISICMKISPEILAELPAPALIPLYEILSWIFKPQTAPPFEFLRLRLRKYYLPGERLENISIVEYGFLDMALIVMQKMEEQKRGDVFEDYLNRLCAYMIRPKSKTLDLSPENFSGDIREIFNTSIIENRLKRISKIKPIDKFLILRYFVGCKRYVQGRYPRLFPKPFTPEGKEIIGVIQKEESPLQWMEVIRKLSGGKFGTFEQTQRANLYAVLDELNDQVKISKQSS